MTNACVLFKLLHPLFEAFSSSVAKPFNAFQCLFGRSNTVKMRF